MTGDSPDSLLVEARAGLIDALIALNDHSEHLVLVGAQAIYLHTEELFTGVALTTKDADIALIPPLGPEPEVEAAMRGAGFDTGRDPGIWIHGTRQVDLLVPEMLASAEGRRSARLPGHGPRSARKVAGLECAAVDNDWHLIRALDPSDPRAVRVRVAGSAALLVSKAYKLGERAGEPGQKRLESKDAFDYFRLLQLPLAVILAGFVRIASNPTALSAAVVGLAAADKLFANDDSIGSLRAGEYVAGVGDSANVRASVVALTADLMSALRPDPIWRLKSH